MDVSQTETDLLKVLRNMGDEGVEVIRRLVDIYEAGMAAGEEKGRKLGFEEGVAEARQQLIHDITASQVTIPDRSVEPLSPDTPISAFTARGLHGRVTSALNKEFYRANHLAPEGTLAQVLDRRGEDFYDIRNFGKVAGHQLAKFLEDNGYPDKAREILNALPNYM